MIKEAVNEIRLMSADEKARKEAFDREAQIADTVNYFASAERKGRKEGRAEERAIIVENLRKLGISEDIIKQVTEK